MTNEAQFRLDVESAFSHIPTTFSPLGTQHSSLAGALVEVLNSARFFFSFSFFLFDLS